IPDDPPSILPRGTIIRPSMSPRPHPPASAVYIQSVAGFCCIAGQAAGMPSGGGGGPPASRRATRQPESSESLAATTAPADPPPTTTKSNCPAMPRKRSRHERSEKGAPTTHRRPRGDARVTDTPTRPGQTVASAAPPPGSTPEAPRRDLGAVRQRPELAPRDVGIDALHADVDAEPAVDPRHHPVAAYQRRVPLYPLGDEFRVFDVVGWGFGGPRAGIF